MDEATKMKAIRTAMNSPDDWVVQLDYHDKKGTITRRVISPIRFAGNKVMALCLCREEARLFSLNQCSNITLQPAANFVMPVPMEVITPTKATTATEDASLP